MHPSKKKGPRHHHTRRLRYPDGRTDPNGVASLENQIRELGGASIKGVDDCGRFYNSHAELEHAQLLRRDEFYTANALYWINGGYGGSTDDEVMVGDTDGLSDGVEGLAFLDRLLQKQQDASKANRAHQEVAVDLGAGVGRVTKHILLKRYKTVRLVEGDADFSKRSRVYLGRKRAARCIFTHSSLQDLNEKTMQEWGEPVDLMWVQWTLQYLTDEDVVKCLMTLSGRLRLGVGILVVKENRPFGTAREDRFQMDTPTGESPRYDITRPDAHHRLLFQKAGLLVDCVEKGEETNTYSLRKN